MNLYIIDILDMIYIYIYSAIVSPEFLELSPHPGRPSRMARAARDLDAAIFRLESTGYFYGK